MNPIKITLIHWIECHFYYDFDSIFDLQYSFWIYILIKTITQTECLEIHYSCSSCFILLLVHLESIVLNWTEYYSFASISISSLCMIFLYSLYKNMFHWFTSLMLCLVVLEWTLICHDFCHDKKFCFLSLHQKLKI